MHKYNPHTHHRKSIRLKGYDYSQAGLYFITMCVQNRECLFGHIINNQMILNDSGMMVEKWYQELENKFPDLKCHEMIIMPNHYHCIIENRGAARAGLTVCPKNTETDEGEHVMNEGEHVMNEGEHVMNEGEHVGSPLHRVIQWFKTMTTNEYIRGVKNKDWPPFKGKLWQRNYYEHIIRNEKSYEIISQYIINNPTKWAEDKFYM